MAEARRAEARYLASRCPACGTPKTRPSATAYVYCDACGALADYDFRKACEQPMRLPGPVYRSLQERLAPKLAKAQAAGDRDAYRKIQLQLFDAWVTACPTWSSTTTTAAPATPASNSPAPRSSAPRTKPASIRARAS